MKNKETMLQISGFAPKASLAPREAGPAGSVLPPKANKEVKEYLGKIGSIGGKKSKRSLSSEEARAMARARGKLKQGTKVMCNGYEGAVVRHYDGDMYEIRLPGGLVCTDNFELLT
jgi:hypothetical protein